MNTYIDKESEDLELRAWLDAQPKKDPLEEFRRELRQEAARDNADR